MNQSREIEKAVREMLPFLEASPGDALAPYVEATPAKDGGLLRRFYLFRASSAVLPDDIDDIQRFIEQRYRSVLSAAHSARWTVLTAAVERALVPSKSRYLSVRRAREKTISHRP